METKTGRGEEEVGGRERKRETKMWLRRVRQRG